MPSSEDPEIADLEPIEDPRPAAGTAPLRADPRRLERAPLLLRKSALILIVATLLPWLRPGGFEAGIIAAKALVLLGGWVLFQGVTLRHGGKVPGFLAALGRAHPRALELAGGAVMGLGIAPAVDGWHFGSLIEKAALAVALTVWVQIANYERGGRFNPALGLILPLFGLAGLGRIATLFSEFDPLALLGSLGVVAAGVLSGHTLVVALKEAKAHGEAKKRAQVAERKRQREARRAQG